MPYIRPDPQLVEKWRREFPAIIKFKVGINWQGKRKYRGRLPLLDSVKVFRAARQGAGRAAFQPAKERRGRAVIADRRQVRGDRAGEPPRCGHGAVHGHGGGDDLPRPLHHLRHGGAHLAGSLGVPVWMALSTTPDWRWLSVREDNPWYPTMRIFRQQKFMEWVSVFDRIAVELRKTVPSTVPTPSVAVETAPGELIDKITILEIKAERMGDPEKVRNVRTELDTLAGLGTGRFCRPRGCVAHGRAASVNEALWDIEDEIRACERAGDFGPKFVELARSVYFNNDNRAAIKRKINVLLGSKLIEEKSYDAN